MANACDTILLSVGLIPENELTRQAGIAIDSRTGGAIVFQDAQTSVPGVFACGNAVHVHDLVDFVTEESMRAGKAAARFARLDNQRECAVLELRNGAGVTYTVPQRIRVDRLEAATDIFFRVSRIFGKSVIKVVSGGEVIAKYRREYLVPGEMERIALPKKLVERASADTLELMVEEAEA
jgi:hypothetical protein